MIFFILQLIQINTNFQLAKILFEFLLKAKPDIIILAGFARFLPISIISLAKIAVINLHAGKLPEYRGTSVVQWQIIKGENQVGCAIHIVDKGIDTGPVLTQSFYPIEINSTSAEIMSHNQEIFPILLAEVIEKISKGTAQLIYQDESKAVYYSKLYQEDALIQWHQMKALEVHNLVRAFNLQNQNGAFTYHNKTKIIIHKTSLLEQTIIGVPGRVLLKHPEGVIVMCMDKAILICKSDFALHRGQKLGDE
jgi:methionyl-tRNA formyltransferase